MSGFKERLLQDNFTFINADEFGESVEINGVAVSVSPDEEKLEQLRSKDTAGLIVGDLLIFISESEYRKIPKVKHPPCTGDALLYGLKPATITKVNKDFGIYQIVLRFTGAR